MAPDAQLLGDVTLGAGSSVWYSVVMRAEMERIEIGENTNIQDFVMIHVGRGAPTIIGANCSITHRVTLHGATVEDDCLIGIGATLMDGVVIGAGSIVAGGSFIPEGKVFPPGSIIVGSPAKLRTERNNLVANRLNAVLYRRNAEHHARGEFRGWSGPGFETWMAETERRLTIEVEASAAS